MPAINDKTAASTNAHDIGSNTREAALTGALRAFATRPNPPQDLSLKTSSSVGTALGNALGRRPPPRPATSSQSVVIKSRPQRNERRIPENKSNVNVAAKEAVISPEPAGQTPASSKGNVTVAKLTQSTISSTRPADLKLAIPVEDTAGDDGIIKAQGPAPQIQSPKPIRRIRTAASFEAATTGTKSHTPNVEGLAPDPAQSNVEARTIPSEIKSPSKPQPPPAYSKPLLNTLDSSVNLPVSSHLQSLADIQKSSADISLDPNGAGAMTGVSKATPLQPRKATLTRARSGVEEESAQRINALANAIVASHLASSRGPSPVKSPGPQVPILPRRQTDKGSYHFPHLRSSKEDSRTPSPAKRMRQTLRKPPASSSDEDQPVRRPRGHFHLRQHPNKHHEGDRKRWRDEITFRERKRYEGVWAANKDLHMRYTPDELLFQDANAMELAKGSVSALVVKDIWARSRLPDHFLEEIWELVDRKRAGRLDREEFVVGLWLVDQTLRGRKLPPKVGPSVWQSVRGIYGLKVRKAKQ